MTNRVLKNIKYVLKLWKTTIFSVLSVLGIIASFFPIPSYFDTYIVIIFIVSFLLLSLLSVIIIVMVKKRYVILETGNDHYIYVQYGDIFDNRLIKKEEKRIVIIPVNRCFDIVADDELIAQKTVHGQCLSKLIPHRYSISELREKIDNQLINNEYLQLTKKEKPKGNLKRYPVGTIVKIPDDSEKSYFFIAVSSLDQDLHANTSDEDIITVYTKLFCYINRFSQGHPVIIPLIGAGAANTGKTQRDILEVMIKILKLNRNLINCDIHIVVYENSKNSVAITGL